MNKSLKKSFSTRIPKFPSFSHTPKKHTGLPYQEAVQLRHSHFSAGLPMYFPNNPLFITEGKAQYVYDDKGKRYLDLIGGILCITVGHSHDRVTKALNDQMSKINHTSTLYLNEPCLQYAKELTAKFPKKLSKVIFCNSGSEANETAIHLAKIHTKSQNVISLREAYHGTLGVTLELTSLGFCQMTNFVKKQNIEKIHCPDLFNGIFSGMPREQAIQKYIEEATLIIRQHINKQPSTVIMEPIQGLGGINDLPPEWMRSVIKEVRSRGGLWISDEVQTGFGRLGKTYWGWERTGEVPDIVTMAKGIGNGFPLSAVVTTPEIADSLTNGYYFNTFGGNPLATRVGLEVLRLIDEEKLQENALKVGGHFKSRLHEIQKQNPEFVGDVRGDGLMLGIEITKRNSKESDADLALSMINYFRENQVLLGKGGIYGNIVRFGPPMCLTKEDVDYTCDHIEIFLEKAKSN